MHRYRSHMVTALLGASLGLMVVTPAQAADCSPNTTEAALDHVPWAQQRLAPERVWPLTTGEAVTVAVIDSGVSDAPQVLSGKVSIGDSLIDDGHGAGCDLVGHGTSIAGIIAGRTDSDSPFAGMAPKAKILSIRVMADLRPVNGEEIPDHLATAIRQATDAGADVINLSIQVSHTKSLEKAVSYAADKGVLLVAAAGNQGGSDGSNQPQYPAAYDNDAVLAVASIGPDGTPAETSNTGEYLDIAAPGENIEGPGPKGDGYTGGESASGTSFATAFVSGTAALLRSYYPDASPEALAARMKLTAEQPAGAWSPSVGFGMVDPYRAVTTDLDRRQSRPEAAVPVVTLQQDTQASPRTTANLMVAGTAGFAVLVGCAAAVRQRMRRVK